ncbi:hypothetical protein [Malacoplasma muris]|uniref:hypothetical protein n=1 Tax=Malacoplasma muris TaxID=2119 RepID=UPI00398E3481
MKNKKIDLNKSETQSESFNKKQLIDFIRASNTCIGKDILFNTNMLKLLMPTIIFKKNWIVNQSVGQ